MSNEHDTPQIETEVDLAADFQKAAAPEPEPEHEHPAPELRPPALAGPGLGSVTPGTPNTHDRNVSPSLRDMESSPPKRLADEFNIESSKGAFREMFNRKARERESEHDMDR